MCTYVYIYEHKHTCAYPYVDTCAFLVLFCGDSHSLDRTKAQHSNTRKTVSLCFDVCMHL